MHNQWGESWWHKNDHKTYNPHVYRKECGLNNHSSGSNIIATFPSKKIIIATENQLIKHRRTCFICQTPTAQSCILTGTKNYTAIEHGWPKIKTLVWNADAGTVDTVPAVHQNGKIKGQKKGPHLLSSHAYNADTWWRKFGCHYMWTRKGGKSKDAMLSITTLLLIMWGRCFLAKIFTPGLLQLPWNFDCGAMEPWRSEMPACDKPLELFCCRVIFSKLLNDNFARMRNICYCKKKR